ncbi:hypothetical protein PHMEG_00013595 [Phytophthora megakarya]|uniref:Bzip transcription factor n=1 Tax=Phytophthora megakarya TaxID=4795 RepID=A0A225W5W8_9STRA|nr:hypothetical protein PHMEG_00013595 [Phytophthora megakarya]
MAPNVRDGDVCGPRALLDRWTMFSHCFDDVQVVLQRLEKGPIENSAVATVITSFTISPNSLRLVFPHLTQENEPGSVTTSLTNKLRGQRLVVRGSAFFEWDDTIGRVTSILSESDMLTPLLQVLGNLGDVNRVFNGALVSPESIWTTRSV